EAVWATALGASHGLRRLRPSIVFLVAMVISVWGLAVAMQTIPTGTAYAVWTATGASLTVLWATLRGTEPVTLVRMLLLLGIVSCVVGLKVVSGHAVGSAAGQRGLRGRLGERAGSVGRPDPRGPHGGLRGLLDRQPGRTRLGDEDDPHRHGVCRVDR